MTDTLAPQGEGAACAPKRLYGFFSCDNSKLFWLVVWTGALTAVTLEIYRFWARIHPVWQERPMPERQFRRRRITIKVCHLKSGKPFNRFAPNRAGCRLYVVMRGQVW